LAGGSACCRKRRMNSSAETSVAPDKGIHATVAGA
jgi:hypothetical protein